MDINSVDFVKAFHDRLVEAGYSRISITNRDDGCIKILDDGTIEPLEYGYYNIGCLTPLVNGRSEWLVFRLTKTEMDEIPHNVVLDYEELEKYFGRSFD